MTFIAPIIKGSVEEDIFKTNKRIDSINVVNQAIIQKNDSITKANAILIKEIDYKENLLSKYDTLNNIVFVVIGLVLTFLGIILPIIGYVFLYRPAREDLKEAQELQMKIKNDMNSLFEQYFKNHVKKLIDDILENIDDDTIEASNKMGQLGTYEYEKFDNSQVQKMIGIIKKKGKFSQSLLQYIIHVDNIYSEVFFAKCIKDPTFEGNDVVIRFFAKHNKTNYLDDIAHHIIRTHSIINISYIIRNYSIEFLIQLFNNDILEKGTTAFALQSLNNAGLFNDTILKDTKIYKKHLIKNSHLNNLGEDIQGS